ncbi:MAG TPA: AMP-binding protein [Gemmatimonadaceae bacterium]
MHLTQLFDHSLVGRADRPAVDYVDATGILRTLTFGELDARANRLARELRDRGIAKGDRLCLHLANRIEYIDMYLACVRIGVVLVPMNVLYRERELRHIVTDSDPKAVVTAAGSDATYPENVPVWTIEDVWGAAVQRHEERGDLIRSLDGDDPAVIVYTSGTTGTAKGAVLSHNNLAANGINVTSCWRITDADRYLAVLPLFHVHGLGNGLHAWLISGCRMRLAERFDQRSAEALFTEFEPTLFFGVPTIYVRLLDPVVITDEAAQEIGQRARLFVSGSAPLPAHVHEAFRQRFGHTILERYGMSEALMIMTNPYEGERRPGTVGAPFPGVSARLTGENGSLVAEGEVGEVEVKSPALIREYWRRPDATEAAFRHGWFKTGDLAVRSPDGYYTLRGRRGDLIISGGFNIYPREIEELLLEEARVREAAVIGVPDAVRGEVPVAYVVADESMNLDELTERCRTQLASFKVPRQIVRVDALPRTALGKVQKHLLPPVEPTASSSSPK